MTSASTQRGFRPDIQGLRAIAVLLVLVYHIWPGILSGGYVGVDVFFVISGYLITGLLLRELDATGKISLRHFYARRIKRLLPAATATLVAVALASVVLLPSMHWQDTAIEVVASAFYVENWWLAFKAVDYLAAEGVASPVQHYWSLSVEEQFYIFWPGLLLLAAWAARSMRVAPARMVAIALVLVGGLSLGYSLYATATAPESAYFATTTRIWELALGACLALGRGRLRVPSGLRAGLGYVGLVGMIVAAATFTRGTPFPGYAALLPTLSAALVLLAGEGDSKGGVSFLLGNRPARYLGDISYSLYLVHWPVLVFYGHWADQRPGLLWGLGLAAVSIVLAHLSKRYVEDPLHRAPLVPGSLWKPYAVGTACLLVCGFLGTALYGYVWRSELIQLAEQGRNAAANRHPGAMVLLDSRDGSFIPSLTAASRDNPDVYRLKCHGDFKAVEPEPCIFGPKDASDLVVLVGDSHAAQWVPALQALAEGMGFRLYTFTKSSCPFSLAKNLTKGKAPKHYQECDLWNRNVLEQIGRLQPALVVASQSRMSPVERESEQQTRAEAMAPKLAAIWKELDAMGVPVMAIRDTPRPGVVVPDCLAKHGGRTDKCTYPRKRALGKASNDPIMLAARGAENVTLLDLTDAICGPKSCEPIVGSVLVWRDSNHLTATYSRSMAPALRATLGRFVGPDAQRKLVKLGNGHEKSQGLTEP